MEESNLRALKEEMKHAKTKWKNDETLALEIERKNKDFDSRLISSIQFAKRKAKFPENAPMSMVHNMILETKDVVVVFP